ncbi:hypothetical protein GGH94_003713 [Coemansia aciculifera]|uniref:GST N-terminal domain-containing protein n=1 Tax=Coemansia aciculifera TaxID=417176 RepID=A0A9W8M487_9FUNG|nr:hypothetical protein GGH94_003713 [Coemansia aciculifera]KAJ2873624.1 hypothetical protein GGH93_003063 [Coemansia aciculifera]KAJ2880719.1 hypothetical protein H4R27_004552 [Coemansia aciculifera]
MSQHRYVLRYFDIQGLCETLRLLLTASGVDWTEEHPEWPKEKTNQPMGHLPVLVVSNTDGKPELVLSETLVIERYIAREYGLLPADNLAAARQEQLRDQLHDVGSTHIEYMHSTGERSAELVTKFEQDATCLVSMHVAALRHNGNNGHYFGDALSYVDLAAYAFFKFFSNAGPRSLKSKIGLLDYTRIPEVSKLMAAVEASSLLEPYFTAEKVNGPRLATRFK